MKKILITLTVALLIGGCSNFLQEYSQDLAKIESFKDLDEVLLGEGYLPYAHINSNGGVEDAYFQCMHYMSDELSKFIPNNYRDPGSLQQKWGWHTWQQIVGLDFEGGSYMAENSDWEQAYLCINACNSVLSEIDKQSADGPKEELEKVRIKGEAAFLRGLYYFTLVNLYGKPYCTDNLASTAVPLKLSAMVEDKDYTCATIEEIYAQILDDLATAEQCLVQTEVKNFPYRADITAVYLLKSRVFLYMQDWKNALDYAQKTLARNKELLNLNTFQGGEVLEESSPEIIFSMGGYVMARCIHSMREFSDNVWNNLPNYIISNDLVEAFDEGGNDLRTRYYICKDTVGKKTSWGYSIPYTEAWTFRKVHGWESSNKNLSDNFLFRTAEAYLNGAEAAALAGDETTARTLLKTLRDNRLAVSRAITESGQQLIDLIRQERQRELCLDGHRWFDLRRYSVRKQYPYSKKIVHTYTKYKNNMYNQQIPSESWSYVLEENDAAYTLALPREVLEFQNTLGSNFRPAREGVTYTPSASPEVTPPGNTGDPYKEGHTLGMTICFQQQGEGNVYDFINESEYQIYSPEWHVWFEGFTDGWNEALMYM